MSNGTGKHISIGQAISWILAVATFFAGVTFGVVGNTYRDEVKLNSERSRKNEIAIAVQSSQYRMIMEAITELKVALKEHQ